MDLASDLTQALDDGAHAYLYGYVRIAQENTTGSEYFLGDALGSVRQLADESGEVSLAKTYDPYGVQSASSGAGETSYGYTGEQQGGDLVYLRARMYAPSMSRFLTRDAWTGDANTPISFNKWLYAYGDSINLSDPSGESPIRNCNEDEPGCIIATGSNIPLFQRSFIRKFTECNEIILEEHYKINLSAYFMPVSKGGIGEQFGEPILKYVAKNGRKIEKYYYTANLGTTKKKKDALRTSTRLLYDPEEGICMQGTGKIEIDGQSPVYVYCLGGLTNPKEETPFYGSWGIYPDVQAFETAARARNNSIFRNGERVRIPILGGLFENSCNASSHDDVITIRSVGGGLSPNTLDIFVGAGDPGLLRDCMKAIHTEGGTGDLTDAYVNRNHKFGR